MKTLRLTPIKILLIHTAMVCGMVLFRIGLTSKVSHLGLCWNLFLAWVPLIITIIWLNRAYKIKSAMSLSFVSFFIPWLLFFPNAPYLITDVVHLRKGYDPIMWYDIVMYFSAGLNGLIVGSYSLHKVFKIFLKFWSYRISALVMTLCVILCGYGIYLGRILRYNSWDIITNPITLLSDSAHMFFDYQAILITLIFSPLIMVVYFTFLTLIKNERALQ